MSVKLALVLVCCVLFGATNAFLGAYRLNAISGLAGRDVRSMQRHSSYLWYPCHGLTFFLPSIYLSLHFDICELFVYAYECSRFMHHSPHSLILHRCESQGSA